MRYHGSRSAALCLPPPACSGRAGSGLRRGAPRLAEALRQLGRERLHLRQDREVRGHVVHLHLPPRTCQGRRAPSRCSHTCRGMPYTREKKGELLTAAAATSSRHAGPALWEQLAGTLRPLERTLYCVCSSSLSASRRSSRRATSTSLVPASANLRAAAKPIPADAPATQKAYGLVWCSQTLVYAWTAALQSKTFAVNTPPLNLHGTPVTSTVQPLD